MGRLDGKVVLITGAARGQGRSHAITVATEGADVVLVDACADIESNTYPLASRADLDHTAAQVKESGRRAQTDVADVREPSEMADVVARAVAAFGRLDVVVANAGICPLGGDVPTAAFHDVMAVNFSGVVNTVGAALPYMVRGGSIIVIGSVVSFTKDLVASPQVGPGNHAYWLSKRFAAEYIHSLARTLATSRVRVNAVHPSTCGTDMVLNPATYRLFRPDLEEPTLDDALGGFATTNAMGVPWIEPLDVSRAVVYLASDESRYVTGAQLRVDAGAYLRERVEP